MRAEKSLKTGRGWVGAAVLAGALATSALALFGGHASQRLPLGALPLSVSSDVQTHSEMLASAAEAQREGHWPFLEVLRVYSPSVRAYLPVQRYPLFQFYSYLPYQLAGPLLHLGLQPYPALVWMIFFSFVAGFAGAYVLVRRQGASAPVAGLCAVVFTLAPYHLTDVFGRYAYPEIFCFGCMPWVLAGVLACLRRPSLAALLGSSLAWWVLILSHNIFHLWAVMIFGLLLLHQACVKQARLQGLAVASAAYALALAGALFFFAGPLLMGSKFSVLQGVYQGLNPAWVLLSPRFAQAPRAASAPYMGLQIGWIFLAAFICLPLRQGAKAWGQGAWLLFAGLALLTWCPWDIWSWTGPLQVIQFPYRLLLFITVLGTLLLGECLQGLQGRTLKFCFALAAAWLLFSSFSWKLMTARQPATEMAQHWQENGVFFRNGLDYTLRWDHENAAEQALDLNVENNPTLKYVPLPQKLTLLTDTGAQALTVTADYGPVSSVQITVTKRSLLQLPVAWLPGLYELKSNGMPLPDYCALGRLTVILPPGASHITYRYLGFPWARRISAVAGLAWLALALLFLWRRQRAGSSVLAQ